MPARPAAPRFNPADRSPFAGREARFLAGRMGMTLFLASLGVLFAASVIGYVTVRAQTETGPVELPPLPRLLWLSTALILAGSVTVQHAVASARRSRAAAIRRAMLATLALGLAFMLVQGICWWQWLDVMADRWARSETYRIALSGFYVFTGIHALHVLGGLIALAVVTTRLLIGRGPDDDRPPGVVFCALYWHFLGAVWLVLFATLMIVS